MSLLCNASAGEYAGLIVICFAASCAVVLLLELFLLRKRNGLAVGQTVTKKRFPGGGLIKVLPCHGRRFLL